MRGNGAWLSKDHSRVVGLRPACQQRKSSVSFGRFSPGVRWRLRGCDGLSTSRVIQSALHSGSDLP
jgi:hypothetical protein